MRRRPAVPILSHRCETCWAGGQRPEEANEGQSRRTHRLGVFQNVMAGTKPLASGTAAICPAPLSPPPGMADGLSDAVDC